MRLLATALAAYHVLQAINGATWGDHAYLVNILAALWVAVAVERHRKDFRTSTDKKEG